MFSVGLVFIFIAGISFLGFAINALFDKIKITSILPLIIIGLIIGPVLNLVNTSSTGLIGELNPYITAIAVAFVLFEVGINMRMRTLGKVILASTKFIILTQLIIGIAVGAFAYYVMGWPLPLSFIFSFAISGPSAIAAPTLAKSMKAPESIKTFISYEGVFSDVLQLVVPLVLLSIYYSTSGYAAATAGPTAFTELMGAVTLGALSAVFWLYILNRFSDASKNYSWMLTIAMVIATYGMSDYLGLNTALAVFIFGIVFANIGSSGKPAEGQEPSFIQKYLSIDEYVEHTREYQREIVFFVSTFFFVYIGLLFSFQGFTYYVLGAGIVFTAVIILSRIIAMPILSRVFSDEPEIQKIEKRIAYFNIARGISPVIIATSILANVYALQALGSASTTFTDSFFVLIIITNIIFAVGVFMSYKPIIEIAPQQKPAKGRN
jgi:NhaP-type Na+/H+ or K+/H+ antiporter